MKRLLSGVQPSGNPHIGNYFGAMKQFVDLVQDYESFVMIADYHALTTIQNAEELRGNILEVATDYLAIGLNPKQVTIFQQSTVPQHTELAWIFDCITTVPYLQRAHAYKDKTAKGIEASVGLFNYPVLQAADILLYDPDIVPVGQDQKQHVEMARDIAEKFNNTWGEIFKLPDHYIPDAVAVVPGTDGQKMSKSYKNTIPLFGEKEEIRKAVMSIMTDSSGDFPEHVFAIHKLFKDEKELAFIYESEKGNYQKLKEMLAEDIETFIAPIREKRKEIEKDREYVLGILTEGGERAREQAEEKMRRVREVIGVRL